MEVFARHSLCFRRASEGVERARFPHEEKCKQFTWVSCRSCPSSWGNCKNCICWSKPCCTTRTTRPSFSERALHATAATATLSAGFPTPDKPDTPHLWHYKLINFASNFFQVAKSKKCATAFGSKLFEFGGGAVFAESVLLTSIFFLKLIN